MHSKFYYFGDQLPDRMVMLFLAYFRVQSDFSVLTKYMKCLVLSERKPSMHMMLLLCQRESSVHCSVAKM